MLRVDGSERRLLSSFDRFAMMARSCWLSVIRFEKVSFAGIEIKNGKSELASLLFKYNFNSVVHGNQKVPRVQEIIFKCSQKYIACLENHVNVIAVQLIVNIT